MLNHLLNAYEAHLGPVVLARLEVFLGITSGTIEEVEHFGLLIFKVVIVHSKLPFYLELLALEGRVDSIRQGDWIGQLLRIFRGHLGSYSGGVVPLNRTDKVLLGRLCRS